MKKGHDQQMNYGIRVVERIMAERDRAYKELYKTLTARIAELEDALEEAKEMLSAHEKKYIDSLQNYGNVAK